MEPKEPTDSPEDTLSDLNDLWGQATQLSQLQEQRWALNERLVNSKHLTSRKPGRSSIFVPKTQGYVRRKIADYVDTFTGQSPISITNTITSTPRGAKILQAVVNHYINTKINWVSKVYDASYNALVYEFAPTYVWWEVEYATETDEAGNEVEVVASSYPVVEVIPPENARIDTAVGWANVNDARYLAFSTFKDQEYAMDKAERGEWPKLDDDIFESPTTPQTSPLQNERRSNSSPFTNQMTVDDNGLIEVRVHFYWEEIDGELLPVMAETYEDRVLLSGPTPLPYNSAEDGCHAWPILVGHVYPKPHEQYTAALPEIVEPLQLEVNAIRNQRRDNVNLILNPERIITPDSGIDPANVAFSFPGKVVVSQNINGMTWNAPPDVTASGHNEESVANNDMDRLLSEGPQRAGAPSKRKETATQAQLMAAGSSASVNLDLTIFATSWVEEVVKRISLYAQQAAPAEIFDQAAVSLGMDPSMIDAVGEATKGNFLYNVYAGSTQAELNNEIGNATNIAAIIQQMYGPAANYFPIIKKVLEAGGYDPESIIPNPTNKVNQNGVPDMSSVDMGGVIPGAEPNMQARQATTGGAFDQMGNG